ncbi:MAG: hypothetical protein UY98_C0044G0011 [Candidatus Kaiserbacteria bacterium GW2011_GWA2_58_9]|uniref:DUF721 domain-containing protein n=1 Tax=Candidatus Kaiserbacteria bacterium GW2011_GWA2_58_9 TaxID=1618672 RepID=A0A0G1YQ36_9BACT|nr:MAG: hypothetical protein UY98_C0044G0011 [Candidatus Kaiserbacteria bacterium GW2011_GWA2_58_9]
MKSLQSLLGGYVSHKGLRGQLDAHAVVSAANDWMTHVLPDGRAQDACALSFSRGRLVVECVNASALAYLRERQNDLNQAVTRAVPHITLSTIQFRFVSSLSSYEA